MPEAPRGELHQGGEDEQQVGGVDFATLELRYVSDTYAGGSGLGFAFSANPAPEDSPSYGGRRNALLASDAFFVWMALPASAFTVNLNPDEPDRIIDERFGRTDAGRVLLEADLQMKKTVAKLIHPESATGKRFWDNLDGEKCLSMRQWIVPARALIREDKGQMYIIDAPLDVKMESDIVNSVGVGGLPSDGCPGQSESDTKRNETLFRTTILPQVNKAVNSAPEYADLRRVYLSRVAAQFFRERSLTKRTAYSDLIDKGNVDAWPSREPWDPKEVWQRFVKSYTDGEFKVEVRTERGDVVEVATYVYGGVDLTTIPRSRQGCSSPPPRPPPHGWPSIPAISPFRWNFSSVPKPRSSPEPSPRLTNSDLQAAAHPSRSTRSDVCPNPAAASHRESHDTGSSRSASRPPKPTPDAAGKLSR